MAAAQTGGVVGVWRQSEAACQRLGLLLQLIPLALDLLAGRGDLALHARGDLALHARQSRRQPPWRRLHFRPKEGDGSLLAVLHDGKAKNSAL